MTIGQRIKKLRVDKKMSSGEFAVALEVTPSSVSHYERDQKKPSLEVFIKICEVLDCSLDYLANGKEYGGNGAVNIGQNINNSDNSPIHNNSSELITTLVRSNDEAIKLIGRANDEVYKAVGEERKARDKLANVLVGINDKGGE
jgi:transcriptional regulator with XRE-family HTH domain